MMGATDPVRPLILIICSLNKQGGGITDYEPEASVTSSLEPDLQTALLERRSNIYHLLRNGDVTWSKIDQNDHFLNRDLVHGPDLGGTEEGARYLPALERYIGTHFYKSLGDDGRTALRSPELHTLILTGLYGLVGVDDPIQCYSVPIEWDNNVQKYWCRDNLPTRLLIAYLQRHRITHIFDMTAREDYRDMIDWLRVRDQTQIPIRHCFSRIGAGPDALTHLGEFVATLPAEGIARQLVDLPVDVHPDLTGQNVYLRTVPREYPGLPTERAPIPPESGLFFPEIVPEPNARRILETSEKTMKVLFNSPAALGADAGSMFFVYYGKGLEVLLHNVYGRELKAELGGRPYHGRVALLNELLTRDESASLGAWVNLNPRGIGDPAEKILDRYFNRKLVAVFPVVRSACDYIRKFRNPKGHYEISSMGEMLDARRRVVDLLNRVLIAIYGRDVELEFWRRALRHGNAEQRKEAASAVAKLGDRESVPRLIDGLGNTAEGISFARALGVIGDERALPALEQIAISTADPCQKTARDAIAAIRAKEVQKL